MDRSFPEAADGTPTLPMEPELWAAGCDHETAKFTARMLREKGYCLVPSEPTNAMIEAGYLAWQDPKDASGYDAMNRAYRAMIGAE